MKTRSKICSNCDEGFLTHIRNKKCCSDKCIKEKKLRNQRQRFKEMREIAIELGNCSSCFKEKDNPKYKRCFKCRKKFRDYYIKINK